MQNNSCSHGLHFGAHSAFLSPILETFFLLESSSTEHEVVFAPNRCDLLCRKCLEMVVFINGDLLTPCIQSITCSEINNITAEGPLLRLCCV